MAILQLFMLDLAHLTAACPILVSDDDPLAAMLTCTMLRRTGLNVVATMDAHETLRLCQTSSVSLVISDMMKPGMDGLELLRQLRVDSITRQIPFIFLSASLTPKRKQEALAAGANACLSKPCTSAVLLSEVERVLTATPDRGTCSQMP